MFVTVLPIFVADTKIIFDCNFLDPLIFRFLYDAVHNVLIRECHILKYSCTLYTDIFTVEMKVSFKKRIALVMAFLWQNCLEKSKKR